MTVGASITAGASTTAGASAKSGLVVVEAVTVLTPETCRDRGVGALGVVTVLTPDTWRDRGITALCGVVAGLTPDTCRDRGFGMAMMGVSTSGLSGTAVRGLAGGVTGRFFSVSAWGSTISGFTLEDGRACFFSFTGSFGVIGRSGWFSDAVEERRPKVALEGRRRTIVGVVGRPPLVGVPGRPERVGVGGRSDVVRRTGLVRRDEDFVAAAKRGEEGGDAILFGIIG